MEEILYVGFWSLVFLFMVIILVIFIKQVFIFFIFGIFLGWMMFNNGNFIYGLFDMLQVLVDVFSDVGNMCIIMFCVLVGGLIIFM